MIKTTTNNLLALQKAVNNSWEKIAPFWPLKNLIAVNPLKGFENLSVEQALIEGEAYFQQKNLPELMHSVNRETIKWLQLFFDDGQAVVCMPMRERGLYSSWQYCARFDDKLHDYDPVKKEWIADLSKNSEEVILDVLLSLKIPQKDWECFLTLMLTTLPGWAAHIKYHAKWSDFDISYSVSYTDYLAIRLAITYLLWPESILLLEWYKKARLQAFEKNNVMQDILAVEKIYRTTLLESFAKQIDFTKERCVLKAQFVFCIDVRSEQFRRALESTGGYETYGFAGFFGLPIKVKDCVIGKSYYSCPVLIKPLHSVIRSLYQIENKFKFYDFFQKIKCLYQSLKYNFTTSFALVEILGLASGVWMGLRTFTPIVANRLKDLFFLKNLTPLKNHVAYNISFDDQCKYAESALRSISLTKDFAPIVVFCGHGSSTLNNAYATILDCGACGGNCGSLNAYVLACILNDKMVRKSLCNKGIVIPELTHFIGALHNTTTDEVVFYKSDNLINLDQIEYDLHTARQINSKKRCQTMGLGNKSNSIKEVNLRSADWAQVRPEWGLARNASFIIGPRSLTKNIDFDGRAFLHSYEHEQDIDGEILRSILTAPMVVAQWINAQYLFSALDNVAYGSGSKITINITGKFGIMQGNASDLMTGLPLQSVYETDVKIYHEPQRLMTIVYAPCQIVDNVIKDEEILKTLFGNGWVTLACLEPKTHKAYILERNLTWKIYNEKSFTL